MPTIARFDGIEIVLWPNDHPPPHIHAMVAEDEARISIATGDVLSGTIPRAKLRAVTDWLIAHRESVAFQWDELRVTQGSGGRRR